MPSPKSHRKGSQEKRRNGRSSYDFRVSSIATEALPRTVPGLLVVGPPPPRLTKLLLNVTIQRSLGAVKVIMPPEAMVGDLIAAALRQYEKEARLPLLRSGDASGFDLHYSQFSLESLDREEKLVSLGSRNFFLWPKKAESGGGVATSTARCSNEADHSMKELSWLRFMEFSL